MSGRGAHEGEKKHNISRTYMPLDGNGLFFSRLRFLKQSRVQSGIGCPLHGPAAGAHALSPAHHRGQIPNQPPLPKPRERDRWVKIKWHHGADYCGVFSQPELRDVYEVQNTVKVCIGINKTCEWKIALVRDQSLSCTTFKKFRTSSIESPLNRGALNRQRLCLTFDADSSRKRLGFF